MSQHRSPLLDSLRRAMANRNKGLGMRSIDYPLPCSAPDFFSNDYLSLATDPAVRDVFLRKVQGAAPTRLFGSTGSRLLTGNSSEINALETTFKEFFGAPSALLFRSGFSANLAFMTSVPQKDDVIVYDELVHASCREGIRQSSRFSYGFAHNSVAALEDCLVRVLRSHPQIARGTSTVFVVLESLYSMDGDFCPLTQMVEVVEGLVPAGQAHIVVDEAHTSGICGPNGTGYVSHLGLNDRVHTTVHAFSKGWGYQGAVVLTSPVIREYLSNFTKVIMFSTEMPYTDIYALEACLSVVSSPRGQELRQRLDHLCRYARKKLCISLKNVPESILAVEESDATSHGLCSPIIPVSTPYEWDLQAHLRKRGYAASALCFPVSKTPRIRVCIHAGNSEEEIDSFVDELLAWAERRQPTLSTMRGGNSVVRVRETFAQARAKL